MTVSNAGVVTANSFVGAASSATALATGSTTTRTLASHFSDSVSPLNFGAIGNGTTDDRAALKLALESGRPVDGGGRTYGINGSLQPTSFKGLRNCTLKQLNTASGGANITLRITNIGDFFIDNIKVDRGNNPLSITTNINGFINQPDQPGSCGITIEGTTSTYSRNFTISNVEVFGDGSGNGVAILQCEFFTMHNVVVRDMRAQLPDIAITGSAATNKITIPAGLVLNYPNGTVMMFLSLTGGAGLSIGKFYLTKNLSGNTFELSEPSSGTTVDFTTDITAGVMPTGFNDDDCLQGIWFSNVSNAKVSNCQVQNLECWASPYNPYGLSPRYGAVRSRGFAMGNVRVSNFVGCQAGNVEQGFDFTGTGEGTNGNRDIVISNCYASFVGSVGFKFANACHDITITGCTTSQSQFYGMTVGGPRQGSSVPERILFNGCSVINTGLTFNDFNRSGYERPAFYVSNDSDGVDFSSPRGIRFMNCTVQDKTGMPISQFNLEQGKTYRIENTGTTNWTSIGAASTAAGTIFTKSSTAVTGSGGFAAMLPSRTFNANQLAVNVKYLITSLGTTNWTAIGADASPAVGEVFTKNAVLATGTGTAVQWGPSTTHGWIDETAPIVYPNFGYDEDWSNQLSNCTSDTGFNLSSGIGSVLGIYGGTTGTTQSLAGHTWTNINWNANISDLHGLHNSGTNDPNVYIKTAGWYRVNARLTFTSNGSATGTCGIQLLVNGVVQNDTIVIAQRFTGNPSSPETSKILFLNSGQNVRVEGYQNSGGALNVLTDYSIFQVQLI